MKKLASLLILIVLCSTVDDAVGGGIGQIRAMIYNRIEQQRRLQSSELEWQSMINAYNITQNRSLGREIYNRNPDRALSEMLSGRLPIRGIINLNTESFVGGGDSQFGRRATTTPTPKRRQLFHFTPSKPQPPKPEPIKPLPTFEEIYEKLQTEYRPKVTTVTLEMVRQYNLKRIKTLHEIKTVPLTVIGECETFIKLYPLSDEAKEAQRILDEIQEVQRILLEKQRREKAGVERIIQQSVRQ